MNLDDISLLLEETSQKPAAVKAAGGSRRKFLKRRDLKLFAESLSRLLAGGIPILRAVEAMEKSSRSSRLQEFLRSIREQLKQGMSFKEALENTKAVPVFFSQIVYAGEVSGSTPLILEELSKYLDKEEALIRKIREALAYPLFILLMGFVTLGVLLQVVIPKLAAVYKDFDAQLPLMTRVILAASDSFLPLFIVFVLFVAILSILFLKKKEVLAALLYKAPFFGDFLRMCALVQFSRLFSLLLESGVVILEALEIVASTFSNFLRKDILILKDGLGEGRSFSSCLEPVSWMDDLSKMLVASGEESGRMPESFSQIARDTELRLEAQIQMMVKLLEPAMILVIGLVVGFVVIGTVLPIFDISGLMK